MGIVIGDNALNAGQQISLDMAIDDRLEAIASSKLPAADRRPLQHGLCSRFSDCLAIGPLATVKREYVRGGMGSGKAVGSRRIACRVAFVTGLIDRVPLRRIAGHRVRPRVTHLDGPGS